MKEICPICKGTKHVLKDTEQGKKLVRCRCLVRDEYRRKLEALNFDFSNIEYLIDESGFRFAEDNEGVSAKKIYEVYEQRRSSNKLIVLNCDLSVTKTKFILSQLAAKIPSNDILYQDIADFVNASFQNEKIQLKRLNIVTTLFATSKQLKAKFINDLNLQAKLENKILILLVDDFRALKTEIPELAILFSTKNTLVLPKI